MKIFIAVVGVLATIAATVSLFTVAIVGQKMEWCDLPCGNSKMTCDAPFDPVDVCSDIQRAAYDQGLPSPDYLWIKFTPATVANKRGFRDSFGREVAGVQSGALGIELAFLPSDNKACQTALRHEVRHVILGRENKGKRDPSHKVKGWELFDGCKK